MTKSNISFVGIDVAKQKLHIASSIQPHIETIPYTSTELRKLIAALKVLRPTLVCLEATGGLERRLLDKLHTHQLAVAVVNPRQIRDFARASKTDAIDGRIIARLAELKRPRLTSPLSLSLQK